MLIVAMKKNSVQETTPITHEMTVIQRKSKPSFPSDDDVKKTVHLSFMEIEEKWTMPISNWGLIMNQFMLLFEKQNPDIRKNLQLNPIPIYTKF